MPICPICGEKHTEEENREKEMKKGSEIAQKIANEAKAAQDKLVKKIKDEIEVCSHLQTIYDYSLQKNQILNDFAPYAVKVDPYIWAQSEGTLKSDYIQLQNLQNLNNEIEKEKSINDEWAVSTCSGQIVAKSSLNMIFDNFQNVAPSLLVDEIKVIIVDSTPEHIEGIKMGLEFLFNKESSDEFQNIVDNWNGANDEDKHSILNDFRNFIFDKIIGNLDSINRKYKQTLWFKRFKDMDMEYKEQFIKTRFFILGFKDEKSLQKSTLDDIDSVSYGFSKCYQFMSIFGHQRKGDIQHMETTYKDAVSYLFRMLLLRRNLHSNKP